MYKPLSIAVLPLTSVAANLAEPTTTDADWPAANGPTGSFNPRRHGQALVDDLKDGRLLLRDREGHVVCYDFRKP